MSFGRRLQGHWSEVRHWVWRIELAYILLAIAVAQRTIYVVVDQLKPRRAGASLPWWHDALSYLEIFILYFASLVACGVIGLALWRFYKDPPTRPHDWLLKALAVLGSTIMLLAVFVGSSLQVEIYLRLLVLSVGVLPLIWLAPRHIVVIVGAAFIAITLTVLRSTAPSKDLVFYLDASFTALIGTVLAIQLSRSGDTLAKIGVLVVATPLLIRFVEPLAFFLKAEELWSELPDTIAWYGKWSLVAAAISTPIWFAPRPRLRAALRLVPLSVGTFFSLISVVVIRQHYETGIELASLGLGVKLGDAGMPPHHAALFVVAAGTMAWTLASCFMAETVARRNIGVGLALVVVGGYGFSLPLHYLASAAGLVTISAAARSVRDQERTAEYSGICFRPPPIHNSVWQAYVEEAYSQLSDSNEFSQQELTPLPGEETDSAQADSTFGTSGPQPIAFSELAGGITVTQLALTRKNIPVHLRIEQIEGSVMAIDIMCGRKGPSKTKHPAWSLYAHTEGLLGAKRHPEPPTATGAAVKTGDSNFDRRFWLRDQQSYTEALLCENLRTRATAILDGWIAYWPNRALWHRVHPGRGAALDTPLPISELAFHDPKAEFRAADFAPLIAAVDLLVDMANQAGVST